MKMEIVFPYFRNNRSNRENAFKYFHFLSGRVHLVSKLQMRCVQFFISISVQLHKWKTLGISNRLCCVSTCRLTLWGVDSTFDDGDVKTQIPIICAIFAHTRKNFPIMIRRINRTQEYYLWMDWETLATTTKN